MCWWPCCGGRRTVAKYDPSDGSIVWKKDHKADCYCIAVDSSDNIYTGGDPNADGQTIRVYSSSGSLIRSISTGDSIYGIAVDGSGNIYATGKRTGGKTTWKYDSSGSLVWAVDHGNTGFCLAVRGSNLYMGGVHVDGTAVSGGSTIINFRKYDLGGSLVWSQDGGGAWAPGFATSTTLYSYTQSVSAIAVDASGNVYTGTGLGDTGDEYDLLKMSGTPTGGTFKLQWNGTKTATIPYNATASQVSTALSAIVLNPLNMWISGGPLPASITIHKLITTSETPTSLSVTDSTVVSGTPSIQVLHRGMPLATSRAWNSSGTYLGERDKLPSRFGNSLFVDASGNLWNGGVNLGTLFNKPTFAQWNGSTFVKQVTVPVAGVQSYMNGVAVDAGGIYALSSSSMAIGGAASGYPGLFKYSNASTPAQQWTTQWSTTATLPGSPFVGFPYHYAANGLVLGTDGYPVVCGIRV